MGLREESKANWSSSTPKATVDELKIGCLQRIADATEVMAQNHRELQANLDMYKRWATERQDKINRLERKVSALRGVITRMKRGGRRP